MVNQVSTKDHKGIEREKSIAHRSWREYMACLREPGGEVKAGCRQSVQGAGWSPHLIRVHGWSSLRFPGVKPKYSVQTKKGQGFAKLCRDLI